MLAGLDNTTILTAAIILIALIFDFINGFHDAANSIATIVSTRVLSPGRAVVWAAFFNFVAVIGFGTHVADTVGKGMVDPRSVTVYVILSGLLGAIAWDLLTWHFGLPTSSSHALIGGFGGAALVRGGPGILIYSGFQKTILFIFVAPLLGMVLGYLMMALVLNSFRNSTPATVDGLFRKGQLVSAALYSLGHGSNDAQKTMGIIYALLIAGGFGSAAHRPGGDGIAWWIVVSCCAAMALGTMSGGWRIVRTMGQRITKLRPVGGFCATGAGAISIFFATFLGAPVSTTHVIAGAIMGVGATTSLSTVRWGIARRIVWSWIITIPTAGLMAALCEWLIRLAALD